MSKSEFGKGLTYCLGLFLAHAERFKEVRESTPEAYAECWFNASSDHLYELQWEQAPTEYLQGRAERFQAKCLNWGHGFPKKKATQEDVEWALQEAKDLLRLIDKARGVSVGKGVWE